MPYRLKDFGEVEASHPDVVLDDIEAGEDKTDDLTDSLRKRLSTVGGGKHNDPSRVDSGVFKSMLEEEISPADAVATFKASKRGEDARVRHKNFGDYIQRTIKNATATIRDNRSVASDSGPPPKPLSIADMWDSVLDGRLGEICQRRLKAFPLAYAWPALVTAASVKVPDMHSVRSNLYTSLVGPPGSGKSCVIEHSCKLLSVDDPVLLTMMAGSAEGLFKSIEVADGDARLLNPDELSHLLEKASIDRATFPYVLNTAFYKTNVHLVIGKQKDVFFNCRLSLIGGIVEQNFEHSFGHSTTGGLHDRFIFGLCPSNYTHHYRPFAGRGEMLQKLSLVAIDREVYEMMDQWRKQGLDARAVENAIRVAVICASFDGRTRLMANELEAARSFAKYQTRVKSYLQPNEGLNFDAQCAISIIRILKKRRGWTIRRDLSRAIHSNRLGPGVFDKALRNLQLNGEIEQKEGRNASQKWVRIAGDNSGDTGDTL